MGVKMNRKQTVYLNLNGKGRHIMSPFKIVKKGNHLLYLHSNAFMWRGRSLKKKMFEQKIIINQLNEEKKTYFLGFDEKSLLS